MKKINILSFIPSLIIILTPSYCLSLFHPELISFFSHPTQRCSLLEKRLLSAVKKRQYQTVQELLKTDYSLRKRSKRAMSLAALNNDIPMMQVLRQCGAKIDNSTLFAKLKEINYSQLPQSLITISYLLDHGTMARDTLCAPIAHLEYAELLINHGADVNESSGYLTPLLRAAENDKSETVAFFLLNGAYKHHQEACVYALQNAIDAYQNSRYLIWRIQSKSLEELCKRGAYITENILQDTISVSHEMQKHPRTLRRLLKQAGTLVQERLTIKQKVLDQENLPKDLIELIAKFEVGPHADYTFLLKQAS